MKKLLWLLVLLEPVFETCESVDLVKKYLPYDIGLYPTAAKQISMEDHGVEVAADMLIMVRSIVFAERSTDYAKKYWEVLNRWGDYLKYEMEESEKRTAGLTAYRELILLNNFEL